MDTNKECDLQTILIDKYYNKLNELIKEASKDGVEIRAYTVQVGEDANVILIDSGICVGIKNILNGGNYKKISTWE